MYKITAKEPVSGVGYGMHFVEGVAHTEDRRVAEKLAAKGYAVEELETDPGKKQEPEDKAPGKNPPPPICEDDDGQGGDASAATPPDLSKMGRAELDAYAETLGIDSKDAPNKPAVLELIQAKLAEDAKAN